MESQRLPTRQNAEQSAWYLARESIGEGETKEKSFCREKEEGRLGQKPIIEKRKGKEDVTEEKKYVSKDFQYRSNIGDLT